MTTQLTHATSALEEPNAAVAESRLRLTLRLNAATSLLGGLVAALAAGPINRLLGTSSPGWVRVVGIGLVVFAIDVALLSRLPQRRLAQFTPTVSVADTAWVIASVATIAAGWYSTTGAVVVAMVALAVAAFGTLQLVFRRGMLR